MTKLDETFRVPQNFNIYHDWFGSGMSDNVTAVKELGGVVPSTIE